MSLINPAEILYHVTIATNPNYLIETNRGYVTYAQWVEQERVRISRKSGWPVVPYFNERSGELSLVHLKVKRKGEATTEVKAEAKAPAAA